VCVSIYNELIPIVYFLKDSVIVFRKLKKIITQVSLVYESYDRYNFDSLKQKRVELEL
jgi:hypothetical protein